MSFLIHGILELAAINLQTSNFEKYSLGLSWEAWFTIHEVGSVLLLLVGIFFGFFLDRRLWWKNFTSDNVKE